MPPKIDLTAHQMRALELRWDDWEVKFLGMMLGAVIVTMAMIAALILTA